MPPELVAIEEPRHVHLGEDGIRDLVVLAAELHARVRLDAMADLQAELAQYRARAWREAAETIGPCRVVLRSVPETEPAVLKALAQAIVAESGFVAVLVGEGVPRPLVIARADGAAIDANRVVKAVTGALHTLGFAAVAEVHVGRHLVIETKAADAKAAEASVREMCTRLLANPVTEDYEIASVQPS